MPMMIMIIFNTCKHRKNMYNKDSIKIDKQNKKITIKSLTSAEKEYAIIKYIVTWQYEEYKYKLS